MWALIPGVESPAVRAVPLHLPVFAATGTVALDFDSCRIPDDRIVAIEPADAWRVTDRRRAAIGQPAVLGVADRAIRLLGTSRRADDDPAGPTAEALGNELRHRWARDDEILAALSDPSDIDAVEAASDHRAACLDLARRATTALLAAVGGAGMDLSHPAQRLAREATFYVIQAQTADGREATLRRSIHSEADT